MTKKAAKVAREHARRFLRKPTNGHETMRQIDNLLIEIKRSKQRVRTSVRVINGITHGGNSNVSTVFSD